MRDWAPVAAAVGFGTLFVVMLGFGLRLVLQVKASLVRLERKVASLNARLAAQDAEIKNLKLKLDEAVEDPIPGIIDSALDWRQRGAFMTGALVGARLIRSYWRGRKAKSLPAKKGS